MITQDNKKPVERDIGNDNEINMYLHCGLCVEELPQGYSPKEWSRLQIGMTPQGIQVWCNRHDCNVVHIDFEGQRHPANTTRKKDQ